MVDLETGVRLPAGERGELWVKIPGRAKVSGTRTQAIDCISPNHLIRATGIDRMRRRLHSCPTAGFAPVTLLTSTRMDASSSSTEVSLASIACFWLLTHHTSALTGS